MRQNDIKKHFVYADGEWIWKITRNNRAIAGRVAGCVDKSHGYKEVRINRRRYYVHRLVWVYFNGDIPGCMSVDHINHQPSDNRIENLRAVSHATNHKNQRMRKNNTSGVNGVTFNKSRNVWIAQITVNGLNIKLGAFSNLRQAKQKRLEANIKYGFHPNHGLMESASV